MQVCDKKEKQKNTQVDRKYPDPPPPSLVTGSGSSFVRTLQASLQAACLTKVLSIKACHAFKPMPAFIFTIDCI